MPDAHIIIAGDSNPLGFQNSGPADYVPTVRVQIWTDVTRDHVPLATEWNYMQPGVNTGEGGVWGPEVAIANRWLADNPTGILWIVKGVETAVGGTTLGGDWMPGDRMFESTTGAAANAMRNLGGGPYAFDHYDAAFVGLGENDAFHHEMAAGYLANLTAFNFAARAEWHVDKLVEYRITEGAGPAEDNLAIRQAQFQADAADDHLVTFRTIGFEMQGDGVHYAAAGQVALGNADYDAWLGA